MHTFGKSLVRWILGGMGVGLIYWLTHMSQIDSGLIAILSFGVFSFIIRWFLMIFF